MKPRKKNHFLLLFTTIALAFGFGSSLNQRGVTQTKAAAIPADSTIYFKPNDNWLQGGARFAVYFFTNGTPKIETWVDLVKEEGVLNIYKATSPMISYANLIFVRMNPGLSLNDWSSKWDQTIDLTYNTTSTPLFTLKSGDWNNATGNWSAYNPSEHPLPPSFEVDLALYFKPTTEFMTDVTKIAAYFFASDNGSQWNWKVMNEVDTGVYKVLVPTMVGKEYDRVIFVGLDETPAWVGGIPSWDDNKLAQTGNLVHDAGKELYDYSDSTWKAFTERASVSVTSTTEGISLSKVRIWLDRSGHYEDGFKWLLKVGETLYQATGYEKAISVSVEPISDRYFAYFDMPKAVLTGDIGFTVVNLFDKFELDIPSVPYVSGDNNKIWKIQHVEEPSEWSYTKGAITERIHNTFFAKVLEGYLTCDSNSENGYGAFSSLDANFLPKTGLVWNMEGNLGGILIKDYESTDDYESGTREAVAATDAHAKYLLMSQKAVDSPSGGETNPYRSIQTTGSNVALLVIVSLFFFSAISFVWLRKKTD